ncbi:MAG: sugar phosphate isomerase/epimerase family protein [Planctomycetota bacterium]|jgi:sugar phosphate isomerase/epimerase
MKESLDRRSLLKAAGICGAAAIGTPTLSTWAQGAETSGKWRMRLSTSSIHFMGLPIEQACERIAALGFEAIDIWSAHQGCPHLDDVKDRLGPEGLKDVLAENKLKLFAFSVYKGGYERYAELLGKAGGGVAVRGSSRPCESEELTARMREFLESLKPLAELAEKYDSHLAIENHGNALLCSQDSFKAFVDNNTSPRLGIALAPYHVQRQKESVTEAIRICGNQLLFFYAWQSYKGSEQLPGVGPTDMTPWMRALAEIRYRGYVNPFMHGHPEADVMAANLARSRDYLKECHEKASSGV